MNCPYGVVTLDLGSCMPAREFKSPEYLGPRKNSQKKG
jgi:hypothetical protein